MSNGFWGDFLVALFARKANQGRVKRIIQDTRADNIERLGIDHFAPTPADVLLAAPGTANGALISGGTDQDRARLLAVTVQKGVREQMPVVVLHMGDSLLMTRLQALLANRLCLFSGANRLYDPMRDKSVAQCLRLLMDLDDDYAQHPSVFYFAQVALRLLSATQPSMCMADLLKLDAGRLYAEIARLEQGGALSRPVADELRDLLTKGTTEYPRWDGLLMKLQAGMQPLMADAALPTRKSLTSAFDKGYHVVAVELPNAYQSDVLGCVLNELTLLCARPTRPLVVLDGVSVVGVESLKKWAQQGFEGAVVTVCAKNAFALFGGDKQLFGSALKNTSHVFAMRHGNAALAEPISELLGEFKWTDVEAGMSDSWSWSHQLGVNGGDFLHTTKKQERRVLPEELMQMRTGEVYALGILPHGRILHTSLMD